MLQQWNISKKLALLLVAFSVFSSILMSSLFYFQFKGALTERVLLQLSSVKQLKMVKVQTEIEDRLNAFEEVMVTGEESELFQYIGFHAELPREANGFQLPNEIDTDKNKVTLVDLTDLETNSEIILGFVKPSNAGYHLGIAAIPEIQAILLERTGLGETGESYMVGENYRLLTKSRTENDDIRNILVKSEGVIRAFGGQAGEDRFIDYRNIEVFGAYEQIQINGLSWVLLSEINVQEALSPLYDLRIKLVIIALVILIFILILSYGISKMIVSPIVLVEKKLMRMSQGMLEQPTSLNHGNDEIGHMFEALNKLIKTLESTVHFADKIGAGDFDAEYEPTSGNDKIGEALLNMKNQLKDYKENERRLIQENQQSILSGEEKERARLSKELHDGLGPLLTTLRMNIQLSELGVLKEKLLIMLDETITEVRRMSNNLMPSVLTDFGAGEAIANLVKQLQEATPVTFKFKNDMSMESQYPENIQIALYRIAQEALNNALKHATATEIRVSITVFEDHIGLFISDNGQGFDPLNVSYGNGVRNMKERVKLLNGIMTILSDQNGTTLEIEIPIQ